MTSTALPSSIIGARCHYHVELCERVDAEDSAGEHDSMHEPPSIRIKASLPEHWRWQTLWHELLHMVEEEQTLDLNENQVERLATGLCALWWRNKWEQPGAVPDTPAQGQMASARA